MQSRTLARRGLYRRGLSWRASGALIAILAGFACPVAAQAQSQNAQDDWEVKITPYLWLAGVKGDLGAATGTPPRPVDAHFSDVFDHLSGFAMIGGEVRYGPFGVIGDYNSLSVSGDHSLSTPGGLVTLSGSIEATAKDATIAGFYRVYASEAFTADLVAGARYDDVKVDATIAINSLSASGSSSFDRWNPIIGARGTMRLGDRGKLFAYGDFDPFDGSKVPDWQVLAGYEFSFTKNIAASISYRALGVDLSRNGFSYDLTLAGPLIGVSFRF